MSQENGMKSKHQDESTAATIDRMAAGAHEKMDRIAESAKGTAEQLHNRTQEMKHRGQEMGEEAKQLQDQWMRTVTGYVQEHPVASLGIALASGYLVSRILSSR
ncbi:MAG: hypothetical protein EA349_03425 [Halomonadaceae bacterium]|nr:MAG: hypothetical protein EA349_03425 [Halomonadaceae bacterium]